MASGEMPGLRVAAITSASCLFWLFTAVSCAAEPDARPGPGSDGVLWVDVPDPPQAKNRWTGGQRSPHPRRLSLFDVEVGDELVVASDRLGLRPTVVARAPFQAFYAAAAYRDIGTDIALALGFDSVAIFTDADGVRFRSYVSDGHIRALSFVASTMQEDRYEVHLSSTCRIFHRVETIESVCGSGYVTIDNPTAAYPTAFHYFTRGFSVVVSDARIIELHLYGGLTRDEISRVETALRSEHL